MGVAVLSGVLTSLNRVPPIMKLTDGGIKRRSITGFTNVHDDERERSSDAASPVRFIACVNRAESIQRVRAAFQDVRAGSKVEVVAKRNIESVQSADVVLLWYVSLKF